MDRATRKRLSAFAAFTQMGDAKRNSIIDQGRIETYARGAFLFHEGSRDDCAYFLLNGEIETLANQIQLRRLRDGQRAALEELGAGSPKPVSARALTDAEVFVVASSAFHDQAAAPAKSLPPAPTPHPPSIETAASAWMGQLMRSELFQRIPAGNVHRILTLMERISVKAGDVIIQQDTVGDFFFLITAGEVEVTRKTRPNAPHVKLAVRRAGESFGEEALVSDAVRNATVTMITDGELMRLSKKSFIELIRKPTLNSVSFTQAQMLIREGGKWLDVRFPEEHGESGIEGSINLPLDDIRERAGDLSADQRYVVYCDTGRESSAGAFLLTELGYDVCYLAGGLLHALANIRSGKTGPDDEDAEGEDSDVGLESLEDAQAFIDALEADVAPHIEEEPVPLELPADAPERTAAGRSDPRTEATHPTGSAPHTDAIEATRVNHLVGQLAELKMQLLASMRLKSVAERAHAAAEKSLSAALGETRAELMASTAQNHSLARRIDELHGRAQGAEDELEKLVQAKTERPDDGLRESDGSAQLERLREQLVQAEAIGKTQLARITELETTQARLSEEAVSHQTERDAQAATIRQRGTELQAATQRGAEHRAQRLEHETAIARLNNELREAAAREHRLSNELAEMHTQLQSLRPTLDASKARVQTLEAEIGHARREYDAASARVGALAEELHNQGALVEKLRQENAALKTQVGDLASQRTQEREQGEQVLLEKDIIIEAEQAKFTAELSRLHQLREDAAERLRRERRAMTIESKEVDQQLELALKLRSEAEAAMQAAVQLVKDRGIEPAPSREPEMRIVSTGRRDEKAD